MKRRIGPKMAEACWRLDSWGGACSSKHRLARAVGPHGSNAFGDRIVWRAIHAGLIDYEVHPTTGVYTLTLTDAGRAVLV